MSSDNANKRGEIVLLFVIICKRDLNLSASVGASKIELAKDCFIKCSIYELEIYLIIEEIQSRSRQSVIKFF